MNDQNDKMLKQCKRYLAELKEREKIVQRYVDVLKGLVKLSPTETVNLTYKMPKEPMDRLDFRTAMIEDGILADVLDNLADMWKKDMNQL
jgi:hypothetical protein